MYTVMRENKIITRLFLRYDSVGMIIFASPFSFSLKRIYYDDVCLLGSETNKHVFLHLENKISGSGHLCSATVLHYNAVFSHILRLSKEKCCFCDLDIALETRSPVNHNILFCATFSHTFFRRLYKIWCEVVETFRQHVRCFLLTESGER